VEQLEGRGVIHWDYIESPFSTFAAWVDEKGRLVRFRLHGTGAARVDPEAVRDPKALSEVRRQVDEYVQGQRKQFDLQLAAEGPDFEKRVWAALLHIPFGTTTSYGAVAKAIGEPQAARAVGAANGANPIALIVPCHRVIGADGSLTGYGGGLPLKRKLLAHEARVEGRRFDLFSDV
jgi:methylated-DNA-[protein]-cysteine S-methyltransferase